MIPGRPRPRTVGGVPHDRRRLQPRPERKARQEHQLVDRVVALDVAARVGLRVALRLGLGEHVVVRAAALAHRGQDEVRRPVDDPADPRDHVRGKVRGERREHRDPPADGGLEAERGARAAGDRLELRAVMGDHVLVGRHHRLAGGQRGRHERMGRLVAAHQLDDRVDPRIGDQVRRGVGHELVGNAEVAGPVEALLGHAGEQQRPPVERRRAAPDARGRRARRSRRRCRRRAPRRGGGSGWPSRRS